MGLEFFSRHNEFQNVKQNAWSVHRSVGLSSSSSSFSSQTSTIVVNHVKLVLPPQMMRRQARVFCCMSVCLQVRMYATKQKNIINSIGLLASQPSKHSYFFFYAACSLLVENSELLVFSAHLHFLNI